MLAACIQRPYHFPTQDSKLDVTLPFTCAAAPQGGHLTLVRPLQGLLLPHVAAAVKNPTATMATTAVPELTYRAAAAQTMQPPIQPTRPVNEAVPAAPVSECVDSCTMLFRRNRRQNVHGKSACYLRHVTCSKCTEPEIRNITCAAGRPHGFR